MGKCMLHQINSGNAHHSNVSIIIYLMFCFRNPTPKMDKMITIKWDPVTEDQMRCLIISDKMIMKDEVYRERMKLFQQLYQEKPSSE